MNGPSIFTVLKGAMGWHQARQRVLAENVANANTVGFRASDLKPLDFSSSQGSTGSMGTPGVRVTDGKHIGGSPSTIAIEAPRRTRNPDLTPDGNGVVLEDEMMKLTSNQMDYEMAATLYQKSLGLIKTALGRR